MTPTPLTTLWADLLADLYNPGLFWQVLTIVLCIALGWVLARLLRGTLGAHEARLRVVRLGVESFSRVMAPLLALALIAIAMPILAQWNNVYLLRVAMPLVGSFALIRMTFYVLRRVFARGGKVGNFLLMFEKFFAAMVWIGVALYITGLGADVVLFLEQTTVPIGRHKATLLTILQALASVAVTLILALWAGALLEERLMQLDTMHSSLRVVMARMGRASMVLVAVLVSLSLVGIDLTVLSVFGGAFGVGLGLGLKKIVSSYFSGFVILLERSLSIGDLVTVDNKYSGQVTRINTRYTIVRGSDGVEAVIPNEMLVSGAVQNFSLSDRSVRLATQITVSYQKDIEQVLRLLEQIVANVKRVASNPPPQALLVKFGADGMELEIGFWVADPENGRLNLVSEVNRAIWSGLQLHQINVPYSQHGVGRFPSAPDVAQWEQLVAAEEVTAARKP